MFRLLFLLACARHAEPEPEPDATEPAAPPPIAEVPTSPPPPSAPAAAMTLGSPAFSAGGALPAASTCAGDGGSPPLVWEGAPAGTKTYAIIADGDGPTDVYWVAWNIPADRAALPEGVPLDEPAFAQGMNGQRRRGWMAPCPSPGSPMAIRFTVLALDAELPITPLGTREMLLEASTGHVLARGELRAVARRE